MSSLRRTAKQHNRQPKTYKLTIKSLLLLPFRLCNPPPAVGKVRSCGVTPIFDVSLDDVLDRKHLPPLGLKDFEEWLLYVELSAENLYFILWLREYTFKYKQWVAQVKFLQRESRTEWKPQPSSELAWFYARCKQTFLTPNSNYELNLPSHVLAPFHTANSAPHPDPAVFDAIALEVRHMLQESLRRFVTAQYNNVGNNRVLCGLVAGFICCLIGAFTPILYNFLHGHSRWARLSAFPGLWMGMSLILSSINGICLGIYIFGDLRQLKKFELSRPPISKPQQLHITRPRPVISSPISPISPGPILPLTYATGGGMSPPPPAYTPSRLRHNASTSTLSHGCHSSIGDGSLTSSESMIHISPAYYDADPIEGPAVASDHSPYSFPTHKLSSHFDDDDDEMFVPTAPFIHAYQHSPDDDYVFEGARKSLSEDRQRVTAFDFDALPRKPVHVGGTIGVPLLSHNPTSTRANPHFFVVEPEAQPLPNRNLSLKGLLQRMQSRCSVNKWLVFTSNGNGESTTTLEEEKASSHSRDSREKVPREDLIRKQFKMVKAVPAFGSPLTRVLSPVVVRGQWEIVVRSIVSACLIAWIVLGCLLAIPVPSH